MSDLLQDILFSRYLVISIALRIRSRVVQYSPLYGERSSGRAFRLPKSRVVEIVVWQSHTGVDGMPLMVMHETFELKQIFRSVPGFLPVPRIPTYSSRGKIPPSSWQTNEIGPAGGEILSGCGTRLVLSSKSLIISSPRRRMAVGISMKVR